MTCKMGDWNKVVDERKKIVYKQESPGRYRVGAKKSDGTWSAYIEKLGLDGFETERVDTLEYRRKSEVKKRLTELRNRL